DCTPLGRGRFLEVRSMSASLCALRDDGVDAGRFHRLRVRDGGDHGDHFGASTMALGHEIRIWAAHGTAEYRNTLFQDDLQRAGDEVGHGWARGYGGEGGARPRAGLTPAGEA